MMQIATLGCVGAALCGCVSQTLVMERTSSGAVEKDVDFAPIAGPDGHYISLPAYPLANCVDTLVYDRLVNLMSQATLLATKSQQPRDELFKEVEKRYRQAVKDSEHRKATSDNVKRNEQARLAAARDYLQALLYQGNDGDDERIDKLLGAVGTLDFSFEDVTKLARDLPAGKIPKKTVDDLIALADAFQATPCSSAPRYRNFLGYVAAKDGPGVSWLDRTEEEQTKALATIAAKMGVGDSPKWPTPLASFLHFSDVQIREPNAKLGGTELSHQLKALVSSFEQDYEQEQYALYVYDAIVKTANAEIDLGAAAPPAGTSPPLDRLSRPPPAVMIHTGDSADTGLQSEFDTFLTYTNHLHVPWYQVIGNHDVLAFGNMRLSSKSSQGGQGGGQSGQGGQSGPRAERPDADECEGTAWDRVECTCTSLNALVRNQEIPTPDNRGWTRPDLPSPLMPLIPLLLQRICLMHAVAADWFVMDPDKKANQQSLDGVNSFMFSHCAGWHPKPGTSDPFGKEECPLSSDIPETVRATYVVRPQPDDDPATCAALPPEGAPSDAATNDRTTMHGFDLLPEFWQDPQGGHGYYCFQMKPASGNDRRKVWAVVLNTNSNVGAYGYLSDKQLKWLGQVLPGPSRDKRQRGPGTIGDDDLVLVFSHHPIYSIYDQHQRLELTKHVTQSPNVIGYFAGHIHSAGLRVVRPVTTAGSAKWEIIAPSVIDFPQAARQVTVKARGDLGYIEVLTFTPYGRGSSVDKIRAAERGAIRDKCKDHPDECTGGQIRLPAREVTFPRAFFRMPGAPQ